MNILKQKFRSIHKFPTWIYWLPARLLQLSLHTLYRYEIVDPNHLLDETHGIVAICWHNRLFFFAAAFPAAVRKRTCAVVSASRDGQYIADLCKQWNVESIRGSSSRKSVQVMGEAVESLKNGRYVAMTPDGPRGPRYSMSRGPVRMASETGVKLIPVAINYSSYWELKSWDRFQIPKPFAKVTLVIGEGIMIPPELPPEEAEHWRLIVENKLKEIAEDKK